MPRTDAIPPTPADCFEPAADEIAAPEDCIGAAGLRQLLGDVRDRLGRGSRNLVIDVSGVKHMNARLLATVMLLVREAASVGGRLRICGDSDEFRKWAQTFNVLEALRARGVLSL